MDIFSTKCLFSSVYEMAYQPHRVNAMVKSDIQNGLHIDRLNFLLAEGPAIVYTCNPSTEPGLNFISTNIKRILGYDVEEVMADPMFWEDRVHPEDKDVAMAEYAKINEQKALNIEYRFLHKDGSYRWMQDSFKIQFDEKGAPLEIVGSWMDITDRINDREKHQISESLYQLIAENSADLISKMTLESKFTYVSPSVKNLLGFDSETLHGQGFFDYLHPDDCADVMDKMNAVTSGKHSVATYTCRIASKHGHYLWMETSVRLLNPGTGQEAELLLSSRNITGRMRADSELLEKNEVVNTLLRSLPSIAVFIFDQELRYIMAEGEPLKERGYTSFELTGKPYYEIVAPEKRKFFKSHFTAALMGSKNAFEYEWDKRVYTISCCPLLDKDGQIFAGMALMQDVTEQKRTENAIMKATVEGQDLERKRIAEELHDGIGQKMSAIKISMNNLETEVTDMADDKLVIFNNAKDMINEAVHEVRSVSHNLMPSTLDDFGLENALEDLCVKLDHASNVEIKFNTYGGMFKLNKNVEVGLYRIAQELINNSLKHAQANELVVQLTYHGDSVVLSAEDDGIGFDANINHFENSLGFYNITSRTKALEGQLTVESKPDEGTLVTVEIPL